MIYEISHKDSLYNKAKLSEDPTDWTTFRKKKNEVKKLLSSAKEEFIKDKLESLKNNPRKFWRIINEMSGIGKNTKKGKGCSKIADDNGQIYENIDAAEFLNKYYVNVGPTLAKDHKIDWDKAKCKIDATTHFSFTWINEQEVRNLVKDINITKSSAVEDLSSRLLKDSFEVLIMELTYLYNISLQNGIFPDTWGISRVTPIPKTNCSSKKPGDWRPISQIALPGKILERIIHIQLYNYLNNNNLLSNQQYGFRKGLSTNIAIFDVLKHLYENWNEKEFSGCMFIDFSKAFDTIDHKILFEKLELYGLDENSINFFKSYMQNRSQQTVVNGHTSTSAAITYGTAQGSILGPLIFILYVNDIFKSISIPGNIYMYADDTLIVCKSESIENVSNMCSKSIGKMAMWCEANKLSINYSKTKYMTVKHKKVAAEPKILIGNKEIGNVRTYEYLGILLDEHLSHNEYVDSIWKKANAKIGILSRIRRFITEKTAINIYKCMIRPHLDYIDYVIDSSSADRISKIDKLQNKAIRRIEYCFDLKKRKDIGVLQDEYNIETLSIRRKRNLLKIIYKESKNMTNRNLRRPHMELRSTAKVKMKQNFTSITKVYMSPFYRGLRLWDELSTDLQKESDFIRFKSEIGKLDLG